jgi:hypothetical protein
MIVALIVFGLFAVLCLETVFWLAAAALFWAPPILCGLLVAHIAHGASNDGALVAALGLSTALAARYLMGRLRDRCLSAGPP